MAKVLEKANGNGEAYVALPQRVVLAAYAAAGLNAADAKASRLWELTEDLSSMKKESSAHRTKWILHAGSRVDAQLSFVGRALPPASKEARVAALHQHRDDCTSTFKTSSSVLTLARSFVCSWAKQHVARARAPLGAPDWPSSSSCMERGMGRGGLVLHMLQNHSYDDLPIELPFTMAGAVAGLQSRFVLSGWAEMEKGVLPAHRVTVLSERGLKTRVVTVAPAWCQTLGHTVRKRLLLGLRSTEGTFAPLKGASDEEIGKIFEGAHADVLVSTDLTRATDLLPHDLVSAIVDGLEESGRLSPTEIQVLRLLSGPQDLIYGDETVRSTRGILMGLPTSWVILSLIHLFWCDEARRTSPAGPLRRAHKFSICGDDALLATTAAGARRYRQLVGQSGGEPSAGKHYECTLGYTRRAVFLERLYEFAVCNGRLSAGHRFGAIPLKGLTSNNLPRDLIGDVIVQCRSTGIRQILTICNLWSQSECLQEPIKQYLFRRVPWLSSFAVDVLKLAPGFPLREGGYPILAKTPESSALAELVRRTGRGFGLSVVRELDPCWRQARQWCLEGEDKAQVDGDIIQLGLQPPLIGEGPLLPGQHWLPEGYVVRTEREREMVTTLGMFAQTKAFAFRKNEVYTLRVSHLVGALTKLRRMGSVLPSVEGQVAGERLIGWRLPEFGGQSGAYWIEGIALCQQIYRATLAHKLGVHEQTVLQETRLPEVL